MIFLHHVIPVIILHTKVNKRQRYKKLICYEIFHIKIRKKHIFLSPQNKL